MQVRSTIRGAVLSHPNFSCWTRVKSTSVPYGTLTWNKESGNCIGWRCGCSRSNEGSAVSCDSKLGGLGRTELYQGDGKSIEELLIYFKDLKKDRAWSGPEQEGRVFLVGTGPGDPELLTIKAVRLMEEADVVLYDRLVSEDILGLVNPGALMVYVGKQQSYHTRSQEEIHKLLQVFASEGAAVVRLKGGDPYIFGRGGEEVEYLEARGVKAVAVPGITAAAGISAELGIPLTHRGLATSVRFLTGHAREGGQNDIEEALSTSYDAHTTLVIYMGLGTLKMTSLSLMQYGLARNTPAVAVERGTTPQQRTVWAPLEVLHDKVEELKRSK
eukprot:jgi/Picsp_1/3708/NSC_06544-R1_urophorphyrin methylase 1